MTASFPSPFTGTSPSQPTMAVPSRTTMVTMMISLIMASTMIVSCNAFTTVPSVPSSSSSSAFVTRRKPTKSVTSSLSMSLEVADTAMLLSNSYNACLIAHKLPTQACTGGLFALIGDGLAQYQTTKVVDPKRSSHFLLKGCLGGVIWGAWYALLDPVSESWTQQLIETWQGTFSGGASAVSPDDAATTAATVTSTFDVSQADALWQSEDLMTMSDDEITSLMSAAAVTSTEASSPISSATLERIVNTVMCISLEQFLASPIIYSLWDIPLPAALSGTPTRALPSMVEQKLGPLLIANAKLWTPVNMITYNLPLEFRLLFISVIEILWQSINAKITSEPEEQPQPQQQMAITSQAEPRRSSRKEQTVSV